ITRSKWIKPPATWNAKNPSAHRMTRTMASVKSMLGTPRCDWRYGGTISIDNNWCMALPAQVNADGTDIMAHIDHENREITNAPERARKHDQAAGFAKQRRYGCAALRRKSGDDLG